MDDVQSQEDTRRISINKVGVKNLRYPITVLDRVNKVQHTVATISLYADLAENLKGTHMSRFVKIFTKYSSDLSVNNFLRMLEEIRINLNAQTSYGEVSFPYFIEKEAPVSREHSMMDYRCEYIGEVKENRKFYYIGIEVPVTTLCPCSKEISKYGAHNQRCIVTVTLYAEKFFWIEEIISIVESAASSELYTLLKREDEKVVTETAYDNPKFVEDLVREVTQKIEAFYPFRWFRVEAEAVESIHNHSAYAYVERGTKQFQYE